jgi:hypothetical protein
MAQVVELPGESNPLNPHNLLHALALAASSTQQQVQTGTKQLQHWEKHESYFTLLQVCRYFPGPVPSLSFLYFPSRILTKYFLSGCIPRSIVAHRSPLPVHHPVEEWH